MNLCILPTAHIQWAEWELNYFQTPNNSVEKPALEHLFPDIQIGCWIRKQRLGISFAPSEILEIRKLISNLDNKKVLTDALTIWIALHYWAQYFCHSFLQLASILNCKELMPLWFWLPIAGLLCCLKTLSCLKRNLSGRGICKLIFMGMWCTF